MGGNQGRLSGDVARAGFWKINFASRQKWVKERGKALQREQHAQKHVEAYNYMAYFRNHKQFCIVGVLIGEGWQGERCRR